HPSPRLHLVVASRQMPRWPLARLRVAEAVAELSQDDLRFTSEETQELLAQVVRKPVSEQTAATLHAWMDGWAVGLRLAGIVLRDQPGALPVAATAKARARKFAMQYLLEEVVAQQTVDLQQFLLRTAIAERFCPALGDALVDWADPTLNSDRVIAQLEEL